MSELIQRSLRLWQRAQRPGASREDVAHAVAAIPELCSALDAARVTAGDTDPACCSSPEGRAGNDLDRLGRYVAHEVRNRLHLVELSVERAAALAGDPRIGAALDPVRRAFRHLAAIADDLRCAAASPGTAAAERGEVPRLPLRSVVEDLLATSRDLATEHGVALEMDGECPEVEVDAARVELVLVNLLTNALRHADGGKAERWVRVETRWRDEEEGVLEVSVRDNGLGIPERFRKTLFQEPPAAARERPPRRGMGLAIVRQAVGRAGGRVWIESDEGVGTAVFFTLPTSHAAAPGVAPSATVSSHAPGRAP